MTFTTVVQELTADVKGVFTVNSYGGALGTIFDNYNYVSYRPDYVPETWVINSFDSNDLRAAAIFTTRTTGYEHGLQWPLLSKYFGDATFLSNKNIPSRPTIKTPSCTAV